MRSRPLFLIGLLLVAGLAALLWGRLRGDGKPVISLLPLPAGDSEIVWFQTSTNVASWEHFVAGIHHACRDMPDAVVDDSQAFLERTTATPEVVLSWKGRPGKLRFRWYKQSNETGARQWIDALAERHPPPLAIIGGSTSDRALELARTLESRKEWRGPLPLLLITTATANVIDNEAVARTKLTEIYPDRTFRFCFTNEQMARAVVDFVWSMPDLKPHGSPPKANGQASPPGIFPVYWEDDSYSVNLSEEFRRAVAAKTEGEHLQPFISVFPHSVGPFDRANRAEAASARLILDELGAQTNERSLLVVPTATTPARRFLRALTGESPLIGRSLVAVNGDAISINDVYRDGALLWNMKDVPVPLVFFAHQNPVGWDDELPPPAGTDEILLFAKMAQVILSAVYRPDGSSIPDADALRELIRNQLIVPFDDDGNRREGEEYVVCLRPEISDSGRIHGRAALEVWRRPVLGQGWEKVSLNPPLQAPYSPRTTRRLAAVGAGSP